jgi:dTDP-4-dehydrorhamnose 3,5-epimerase
LRRVESNLPGVCVIEPKVFADERGFFLEFFNARSFAELGLARDFVQDNHSRSGQGVLRGLHFQLHRPQAKLIRVICGAIFDVAVDVRRGSPTFGRWFGVELSADNKRMMFVPEGFAHGFYVSSEVAEITYKCSQFYAPEDDRGIAWNDPAVGIAWPLNGTPPILSNRDRGMRTLSATSPEDLPRFEPAAGPPQELPRGAA